MLKHQIQESSSAEVCHATDEASSQERFSVLPY
jgi:hypothetical protein